MTDDHFEDLLRKWGRLLGERPPSEWGDEVPVGYLPQSSHPLSRVGAPPKIIRQRTTMDRGGIERRGLLAQAAVKDVRLTMRVVPASFVDHVPCSETRSMRDPARDFPMPMEVAKIERAALDLYSINRLRGLCLRMAYCTRGSRDEKAQRVAGMLGEPVNGERYKNELRFAKVWVHGRVAA
jgi:hypothetical protein